MLHPFHYLWMLQFFDKLIKLIVLYGNISGWCLAFILHRSHLWYTLQWSIGLLSELILAWLARVGVQFTIYKHLLVYHCDRVLGTLSAIQSLYFYLFLIALTILLLTYGSKIVLWGAKSDSIIVNSFDFLIAHMILSPWPRRQRALLKLVLISN